MFVHIDRLPFLYVVLGIFSGLPLSFFSRHVNHVRRLGVWDGKESISSRGVH